MTKRNSAGGIILADAPEGEKSAPSNESEKGLMIESARIKNFRCFEDETLRDLGRVNVIVGDNGSGKTALLEALYLACSSSLATYLKNLRRWRGFGPQMELTTDDVASNALFSWMFRDRNLDNEIKVELRGDTSREMRVRAVSGDGSVIHLDESREQRIEAPLEAHWREGKGEWLGGRPIFRLGPQTGIHFPSGPAHVSGTIISSQTLAGSEAADRFSELDGEKLAGPVRDAIRLAYKNIDDIGSFKDRLTGDMQLLVTMGDQTIPVGLVSSALDRLVSIFCRMTAGDVRAVFIDEIENGLYHRKMKDVWRALIGAVRARKDQQLFISTHSSDALRALAVLMNEEEPEFFGPKDDIRLIRVSKEAGKPSTITVFSGERFADAIEQDVEVR